MADNHQTVVTFLSYYGASCFKKRYGKGCSLRPVPRALSSSCGTAAFVDGEISELLFDENTEGVYQSSDGEWREIWKRRRD